MMMPYPTDKLCQGQHGMRISPGSPAYKVLDCFRPSSQSPSSSQTGSAHRCRHSACKPRDMQSQWCQVLCSRHSICMTVRPLISGVSDGAQHLLHSWNTTLANLTVCCAAWGSVLKRADILLSLSVRKPREITFTTSFTTCTCLSLRGRVLKGCRSHHFLRNCRQRMRRIDILLSPSVKKPRQITPTTRFMIGT